MENYWLSKFIKYIYIDLFIISFLRGFVINGELLALKVYEVYIYRSVHNQFPERLYHKWRIIGSQSLQSIYI